jgi:hypothetical protein
METKSKWTNSILRIFIQLRTINNYYWKYQRIYSNDISKLETLETKIQNDLNMY